MPSDENTGTAALIVIPAALLLLIVVRIALEATVVLFRIEDHLRALRDRDDDL